jgi:hypothetical protein
VDGHAVHDGAGGRVRVAEGDDVDVVARGGERAGETVDVAAETPVQPRGVLPRQDEDAH